MGSFMIFSAFAGIVGIDWKLESQRKATAIQLLDLTDETDKELKF